MRELRDKVALVTGASRGIGRHIARALADQGTHVAVTARSEHPLRDLANALEGAGVRALAVPGDLTDTGARERIVRTVEEQLGPIDVLVNNAAMESEGAFAELEPSLIDDTIATNLTAVLRLTRMLLPSMLERRSGHVVTIASVAGKKAPAYDAVYGATKAAVVEWSAALRSELEGSGVGVSVVCPGYVSGEGMFARFHVKAPRIVGTVSPEAVARATVKAIEHDRQEVIVNRMPIRPILVINAVSPSMANRLLRWAGIREMQRRKVGA